MPAETLAPAPTPTAPAPKPSPSPAPPKPSPAPAKVAAPKTEALPELDSPDEGTDPFDELDQKVFKKEEAPAPEQKKEKAEPAPEVKPAGKEQKLPDGFRKELEKVKTELQKREEAYAEKERAYAELEAKISDYEAKGKETGHLTERLATLEKQLEEAHGKISSYNAADSPAFKEKWDAPITQAYKSAGVLLSKLQAGGMVQDETTGTTKWVAQRAATDKDFIDIENLYAKSPQAALDLAEETFGRASTMVMDSIRNLERLQDARRDALASEQATWKEKQAAETAKEAQYRDAFAAARESARKELINKYPELYADDPNDPEVNEILTKSRALLNAQPRSFKDSVALSVRHQLNAEAAPVLAFKWRRAESKLEKALATIEEMKKSRPGPGSRSTAAAPTAEKEDDFAGLEDILPSGRF